MRPRLTGLATHPEPGLEAPCLHRAAGRSDLPDRDPARFADRIQTLPGTIVKVGLVFILAVIGGPAIAWGPEGHLVVCDLAWDAASPETRQAIDELLGGGGREEFVDSCLWADIVKHDRSHGWSRPWHFINVHDDATTIDMSRDCPAAGCAVSAIVQMVGLLRGGPADARVSRSDALRYLTHIVGDLHQPLHAGRARDLDGNTIRVTLLGEATTLHRAWDSGLLRQLAPDWRRLARHLRSWRPPTGDITLDPLVWAAGSHTLAIDEAYPPAADGHLDRDDVKVTRPILEARLALAGARLAALLDRVLIDPDTSEPPFWVGSRHGTVFHHPRCRDAEAIAPPNLIVFSPRPAGRRLHRGCPRR